MHVCLGQDSELQHIVNAQQEEMKTLWCFDVAFSYVILFYFPPWCFMSMFNFIFCDFYWQLSCFETAAAWCSYFAVIFSCDFKY